MDSGEEAAPSLFRVVRQVRRDVVFGFPSEAGCFFRQSLGLCVVLDHEGIPLLLDFRLAALDDVAFLLAFLLEDGGEGGFETSAISASCTALTASRSSVRR